MTDVSTVVHDAPRRRRIWIGVALPPVAALLDLEASYALVARACRTGNLLPLHVVHLIGLLLTAAGTAVAWRAWRDVGASWPGDEPAPTGATRFMAAIGALAGVLFTLVAVALWVPVWVLSPCQ